MNLRELRQQVENEMQWHPDLASHRADIRQVINRVYKRYLGTRPWPFLKRRAPLYALPDVILPNADVSLAAGFGPRALRLPILSELEVPLYNAGNASDFFDTLLVGAEFALDSNVQFGPWTIEEVRNRSAGSSGPLIMLDPRANFDEDFLGGQLPDSDFVLRFPRILLPPDVRTVLGVFGGDGRTITGVPVGDRRRLWTPQDESVAGTTGWFLEDFGNEERRVPVHITTFLDDRARSPFVAQRETWPLRETIRVTSEDIETELPFDSATQIAEGTEIRVFCCWFWSGRFGGKSNIATVSAVGEPSKIIVSGFPVLPHPNGAAIEYGRKVAVFMSEGEGAFFLRGFVNQASATTFTISTSNIAGGSEPGLRFPRYDEIVPQNGQYQYLRLAPRGADLARLELEYLAHPRELIEDTDEPEFGDEQGILVWLALAAMLTRSGDPTAALGMAEQHHEALMARHFPAARYRMQRGQVGVGWREGFGFELPIKYVP